MTTLSPAAFRYVGGVFESFVDGGLDLAQIGVELARRGIPRTPCQIVHDLEHTFGFAGYAANHPAPAVLTLKQIDAAMGY